jgi:hypothetical protein
LNERRELDVIDILILFWIMLIVLVWLSPAIEPYVGKARAILAEISLLTCALVFFRYRGFELREICRWNPVPIRVIPYFVIFSIGGAVLLDGIDRIVGLVIPMPDEMLEAYRSSMSSASFFEASLIVIGVGFAAPFVEETIFRGAIQQSFESKSGTTKGVMMTALIFGLIHFQIAWLIQILILSVFLGWMAWQWNSIVPAFFLHAMNNLLSYFLMFNMTDEIREKYLFHGHLNPVIAVAAIGLSIIGIKGMTRIQRQITNNNTE